MQMAVIKVIFLSYIEGFGLFLRSICPTRVPGLLPVNDVATQPAFQIPQYTQSGPQSYIFGFDIIHNSSINSTSHFLSVSCTFFTLPVYISLPPDRLSVRPSYLCSVSLSRLPFIVAHLFNFFSLLFSNHPSFLSPV